MKYALVLLLTVSPAYACDWVIASDRVDPMSDQRTCLVASPSAKMALSVSGSRITFLSPSPYGIHDGLTVRVDDNEPIMLLEKSRHTEAYEDEPRTLFWQLLSGQRVRTRYRDFPAPAAEGDAPICNLMELVRSCQ